MEKRLLKELKMESSFKISPRVLAHLGEDLIKNESIAILELVKNSYDACASVCTVEFNFKDEKNITEGPYSAQNEKGQIIVWTALEKHILPGEGDKNADNFLYIVNAYERGSSYGGGFNVDKTFMRGSIDRLVRDFKKNYCNRDIEESEKRGNYFISKIEAIIEDALAKWTVMPFLWARYKGYRYLHETKRDYFSVISGIFPEKTKGEFEYDFVQEFGTEENTVKNIINSQIDHIYGKIEQSHENYEKRIIKRYESQMKDFDNIYLTIAAIYGIVFGFATLLWKISQNKIKSFLKKSKERRWLYIIISTPLIFIIAYLICYNAIVIDKINQSKVSYPYYLMTSIEKTRALLFSLVAAGFWLFWRFWSQINLIFKKIKFKK